jgi:flagellar L-ring protein precursor FlgH
MVRLALVVVVTYGMCCGLASGQQTSPPQPTASTGSSTRERPTYHVGASPAAPGPARAEPGAAATPASNMQRNGGSLLRASLSSAPDPARAGIKNISVFAVAEPEPKTIQKHALVTIIVREESEVSAQGTTDIKRQSDIDASLSQFAKLNLKNLALEPGIGATGPSVTANATRNFKGEATVDRSDSVIMRVTAEVLDVKPNGTLVLQARKRIKTDEEEQTIVCAGICRVEDITADNTVLSTQLFDLEFTKVNKGQVRNSTKTGLVHKLLDLINPF